MDKKCLSLIQWDEGKGLIYSVLFIAIWISQGAQQWCVSLKLTKFTNTWKLEHIQPKLRTYRCCPSWHSTPYFVSVEIGFQLIPLMNLEDENDDPLKPPWVCFAIFDANGQQCSKAQAWTFFWYCSNSRTAWPQWQFAVIWIIEICTCQCQKKTITKKITTCLPYPSPCDRPKKKLKLTNMCDITWHLCNFPPKPWANSYCSTPARLTSQLVPCQCQRQHVDRSRTWRHQCMTCKLRNFRTNQLMSKAPTYSKLWYFNTSTLKTYSKWILYPAKI